MPTFEGVVVYTIERNGCLNGVYANNAQPLPNHVYNEIAKRKKDAETNKEHPLVGTYLCSWIEWSNNGDIIVNGVLTINWVGTCYSLEWRDNNNNILFIGKGFQTGDYQLTVRYEDVP